MRGSVGGSRSMFTRGAFAAVALFIAFAVTAGCGGDAATELPRDLAEEYGAGDGPVLVYVYSDP